MTKRDLLRQAKELADQPLADAALAEEVLRDLLGEDEGDRWALGELVKLRQAADDWKEVAALLLRRAELESAADMIEVQHRAAKVITDKLNDAPRAIGIYETILEQEPTDTLASSSLRGTLRARGARSRSRAPSRAPHRDVRERSGAGAPSARSGKDSGGDVRISARRGRDAAGDPGRRAGARRGGCCALAAAGEDRTGRRAGRAAAVADRARARAGRRGCGARAQRASRRDVRASLEGHAARARRVRGGPRAGSAPPRGARSGRASLGRARGVGPGGRRARQAGRARQRDGRRRRRRAASLPRGFSSAIRRGWRRGAPARARDSALERDGAGGSPHALRTREAMGRARGAPRGRRGLDRCCESGPRARSRADHSDGVAVDSAGSSGAYFVPARGDASLRRPPSGRSRIRCACSAAPRRSISRSAASRPMRFRSSSGRLPSRRRIAICSSHALRRVFGRRPAARRGEHPRAGHRLVRQSPDARAARSTTTGSAARSRRSATKTSRSRSSTWRSRSTPGASGCSRISGSSRSRRTISTARRRRSARSSSSASIRASGISKGEVFYYLGEICAKQGDRQKAVQMLERAIENEPSLTRARAMLTELKS